MRTWPALSPPPASEPSTRPPTSSATGRRSPRRPPSAAIQAATDDERDVVAHALARWRKKLFVALARNAATPIEHFDLPRPRTAMTSSEVPM
jgi:hypothetical protein